MKIAAAQIACSLGDVAANVQKMREFAKRAAGNSADLVVFPELSDTGYSMPVIERCAQRWSDGPVAALQTTAKDFSIALIAGVSERDEDIIYNSQVFIDASGKIIGKYRKTHLFRGRPAGEDECFQAGDELRTFEFGELRLGLSICYDLRFPELFRMLAIEQRANVFILSSAWPFPRLEHLRTLTAARAIENQSYLISVNRVGTDEGVTCCGSSSIIDPYGVLIASASADREELVEGEISAEVIGLVRKRMAVFEHRRSDLYGER